MANFPKNIAHRGFSFAAPENTMNAFRAAIDAGADGIEFDVQLSKDGIPVIIHDEQVDRTTNGKGFVRDLKYDQLAELDAGSWFGSAFAAQRIPTLEEVLKELANQSILFNIELKTGLIIYPRIERTVVDLVYRYGVQDRVIISSFNQRTVAAVRRVAPHIHTGLLYSSDISNPRQYASRAGATALHPHYANVTKALIESAHLHGLLVNTWTVDEESEMRSLQAMGVDAIITNRPDRMHALAVGS